jgi:hypothetical protein
MPSYRNKILIEAFSVFTFFVGLGGYARYWESKQPEIEIKGAVVSSIEPYHYRSDIWSSSGSRLQINGEKRTIQFPSEVWDSTVKEGDLVDIVARRSFFGDNLDGLRIDDNK